MLNNKKKIAKWRLVPKTKGDMGHAW